MELNELSGRYMEYLRYEKLASPHTVSVRLCELRKFTRYMEQEGVAAVQEIKIHQLRAFIAYLRTQGGYSPVSICGIISTLRSLYSFMAKKGVVSANIAQKLKKPQLEQKELEHFTWEEVERLFLAIPHSGGYLRNICLIFFLYYTGVRMEELSRVKKSDLSNDLTEVYVEKGKGDSSRYLPIHPVLQRVLRVYLQDSRLQGSPWLFPGRNKDKPLCPNRIYGIVKNCGRRAGVEKRVSPHTFRHTFATHLHEKGVDIYRIMQLLGHVNIEKTAIYTHIKDQELIETVERL